MDMRIALVTTEFVTESLFDGGLANYLLRLALSLKKYGHSPIIFVTTDRQEVILYRGIEVHRVNAPFKVLPQLSQFPLLQKFYRTYLYISISQKINSYISKIHEQNPFDLVQYTHLIGLGLFRLKQIPSIVRLSGYTQAWMDAYEVKGYRQQYIFENLAMRRMDGIFGPSQLICSILEEKLHRSIRVIESPYLLDIDADDPRTFDTYLSQKKYLLFFGTIGLMKGVGTITKVLKIIFQRYPNLYFVFIGKDHGTPDGQPLVPQLYKAAGEYQDRVIYLGRLRHEELYPILDHAFAVLLPSRIDNFSNTCIEAMAHKRIVIGTRGASFEQLIEDGKSGFLCEVDNEETLLDAVDKVMSLNSSERELIGIRAWERIQKLHPDVVVNQLLNYYSEVIVKKNNRMF
jgi:glycogen synthase